LGERLTTPLIRRAGQLVPASWDDALELVAQRLMAIRAESGPAAIFHYRSGGSLGLVTAIASSRFFDLFGPVTAQRGDLCSGAGEAAQEEDFGISESHDVFDLDHARHVLVWGRNLAVSGIHLLPRLQAARRRGAGVILIDPVATATTAFCDQHVALRPGGDAALALAVARRLFEWDAVSAASAARCSGLAEFHALCFAASVEQRCATADVPVTVADDLARRLADGPTAILVGWGMPRRAGGGATVRVLDALTTISGNLGRSGGGVYFYCRRRSAFATSLAGTGRPPRWIDEARFGEQVLAASNPRLRALWITAANPAVMLPDAGRVAHAIETRELTVVVDCFLTATARRATVVLPCPTFLEAEDLAGSYGHHWLGAAQPLIDPPPGVRSDHAIFRELAARTGIDDALLAGSTRALQQALLAGSGVTLEQLQAGAVRNPHAASVLFADGKVPTRSGRVELFNGPEPALPRVDATYPLVLMAVGTLAAQASQWTLPFNGPLPCTVHPLAVPELWEGELARLESAHGWLVVRVVFDPLMRRDIALVPKGGDLDEGRCANVLIAAVETDLGGGAALHDQPVRLVPLASNPS
jgi:anaerobic selenocysteine-containing dehydrogenase